MDNWFYNNIDLAYSLIFGAMLLVCIVTGLAWIGHTVRRFLADKNKS